MSTFSGSIDVTELIEEIQKLIQENEKNNEIKECDNSDTV